MGGQAETSWTADHASPAVRTAQLVVPHDQPEAGERLRHMQDTLQLPQNAPASGRVSSESGAH